jgi:hypothetical protein
MEKENPVTNNKRRQRFELLLGEDKAAFIDYTEAGEGVLALTHAEVPEEVEGRGIGNRLVKGTFEIIQTEGLKIIPACPFIAAYLRRHPEHQSLVAS